MSDSVESGSFRSRLMCRTLMTSLVGAHPTHLIEFSPVSAQSSIPLQQYRSESGMYIGLVYPLGGGGGGMAGTLLVVMRRPQNTFKAFGAPSPVM